MSSSPTSPVSADEVIGLANHQLEKSVKGYQLARRLQILALALGVASIFIKNAYTYIPALIALCVQVYAFTVRNRAARCHGTGEDGRTLGFLIDAFGSTSERVDLANWLDRASLKAGEKPKSIPGDYFASKSPAGLRRLCDNLQENAFWGMHQYKATAAYYGKWLSSFAAIVVLLVLASIPLASGGQGLILARVLVAGLASGAALTQLAEVNSWKSAGAKSEILDRRLEALSNITDVKLRSEHLTTVLSAFGDYRAATAMAPPVPYFIYTRERDRVNDLWAVRVARP